MRPPVHKIWKGRNRFSRCGRRRYMGVKPVLMATNKDEDVTCRACVSGNAADLVRNGDGKR